MDLAYNDIHRTVLQALLRSESQCFTQQEFTAVTQQVCQVCGDGYEYSEAHLNTFVNELQNRLDAVGMDLKRSQCHVTSRLMYALVNTIQDEATTNDNVASVGLLLATDLTVNEMEIFKRWVQAIVLSGTPEGDQYGDKWSVGPNLATALALKPPEDDTAQQAKMGPRESQRLMETLINQRWLMRLGGDNQNAAQNGRLALGPRAVIELEPYLKESFGDYLELCSQCQKLVTVGERCANIECDQKLHRYCLARMYRDSLSQKCKCGEVWEYDISQIEKDSQPQKKILVKQTTKGKAVPQKNQPKKEHSSSEDEVYKEEVEEKPKKVKRQSCAGKMAIESSSEEDEPIMQNKRRSKSRKN